MVGSGFGKAPAFPRLKASAERCRPNRPVLLTNHALDSRRAIFTYRRVAGMQGFAIL